MSKQFTSIQTEVRSEPGKAHLEKASSTPLPLSKEEVNQDFSYVNKEKGLIVICDGVSNPEGGKYAAYTAAKAFAHVIEMSPKLNSRDNQSISNKLLEAVQYAHQKVYERANIIVESSLSTIDPESRPYPGCATTLTAIWIIERHLYYLHVGDCRIYIFRNAELWKTPLTTDHTLDVEMNLANIAKAENSKKMFLTKNVLTQAIGLAIPKPELKLMELTEEDTILICSDGLIKALTATEIEKELKSNTSLKLKVEALMAKALSKGARDDVTVALIAPPKLLSVSEATAQISPDFKVSVLKELDFFKGLDFSEIQTLNGIGKTKILRPTELLMKKGALADSFWVILDGYAEILDNGVAGQTYKAGTCLGEAALFHEPQKRMSTARAKTEMTALIINREDWLKIADRDALLARKVFERVAITLTKKLSLSHNKFAALTTAASTKT